MRNEIKIKEQGNEKNRHFPQWAMVTVLSLVIIAIFISIFLYFFYYHPGFLGNDAGYVGNLTGDLQNNSNNMANSVTGSQQDNITVKITRINLAKKDGQLENAGSGDGSAQTGQTTPKLFIGDKITINLTIKNEGITPAQNLQLTCLVPEKLETITTGKNLNGGYDPFAKKIQWSIPLIEPGQEMDFSFTAILGERFNNLESFENRVELSSGGKVVDSRIFEGQVNGLPEYLNSAVQVKDVNGSYLWAEDFLEYNIRLINSGKADGSGIKLSCPIPRGTGYLEGTATKPGFEISPDGNTLEWTVPLLKAGEEKDISFKVVVGDYLTYKNTIKSEFFIKNGQENISLESTSIEVEPYSFLTVVCMGDSLVVLDHWPLILSELLNRQYAHANFNVIESGVKGETAFNAIRRFDADVRIHNPDIIVLGYGANDAGSLTGFYRYHMGILINQAISTGAKVFVHGVGYIDTSKPLWSEKSNYPVLNSILKDDLCPNSGAVYVDIYTMISSDPAKYMDPDGLHWNPAGSEFVAGEVFKNITRFLDINGKLLDDKK